MPLNREITQRIANPSVKYHLSFILILSSDCWLKYLIRLLEPCDTLFCFLSWNWGFHQVEYLFLLWFPSFPLKLLWNCCHSLHFNSLSFCFWQLHILLLQKRKAEEESWTLRSLLFTDCLNPYLPRYELYLSPHPLNRFLKLCIETSTF